MSSSKLVHRSVQYKLEYRKRLYYEIVVFVLSP